jgi:hypothetical protein
LEWNKYFYRIIIYLFGRGLFLRIVILIGINISVRREICIFLKKNERNSHSFRNRLHFSEKKTTRYFIFSLFFYIKKKPFTIVGRPPTTPMGGRLTIIWS